MLAWFKRRSAPAAGPDFSQVDSFDKAEKLHARGELHKLLLLPAEFGGEDFAGNVVYVPAFAVAVKAGIDLNTIMPLAQAGQISRYAATPQYEGKSVVPCSILITATDPGSFTATVGVWGKALQEHASAVVEEQHAELAVFAPGEHALASLGPEEFVRAFIDDYAAWNRYANALADHPQRMDAAEGAYLSLIRKFCLPGHEAQPIAFSSESDHSNDRESIAGVETSLDRCVVSTRCQEPGSSFVSDYEYHLKQAEGRWFLTNWYYVCEDGKYEGL